VEVADPDRQEEAFVGYLITVALYVALLVGGNQVAQGVAVEKSSRIAEVLLGTIQAPQLMAGKIIGIGLLVGGQLLALATPIVVGALVTTSVDLPDDLASDVAVGLMWFVLGFALYSAAYAALGALVDRLEELQSATTPLTMLLVAGYLVSITLSGRLDDPLAVAASLFPLTAPLVMPLRWAAGSASLAELVLAVVLTALTAVLLIRTGGVVYRRAIIRGGRRLRLREVLRG
jgi:ABC-2 type transport system permease protein